MYYWSLFYYDNSYLTNIKNNHCV